MINQKAYIRRMLANEVSAAGGQGVWAKKHRLSPQYVCDVLKGRRDPGVSILRALKHRKIIFYEPRP